MKNYKKKNIIIKCACNFIYFVFLILILSMSNLPTKFDSYVYYKDFKFDAWFCLIIYRLLVYVAYPFILSGMEKILKRDKLFKKLLIENFNIQFLTYTIISAIYVIFGIDKIFGITIFGSSDAFMFVGGFIFTLILNKDIPHLFYDDKNEKN